MYLIQASLLDINSLLEGLFQKAESIACTNGLVLILVSDDEVRWEGFKRLSKDQIFCLTRIRKTLDEKELSVAHEDGVTSSNIFVFTEKGVFISQNVVLKKSDSSKDSIFLEAIRELFEDSFYPVECENLVLNLKTEANFII